jgi:hypothetical protein
MQMQRRCNVEVPSAGKDVLDAQFLAGGEAEGPGSREKFFGQRGQAGEVLSWVYMRQVMGRLGQEQQRTII